MMIGNILSLLLFYNYELIYSNSFIIIVSIYSIKFKIFPFKITYISKYNQNILDIFII